MLLAFGRIYELYPEKREWIARNLDLWTSENLPPSTLSLAQTLEQIALKEDRNHSYPVTTAVLQMTADLLKPNLNLRCFQNKDGLQKVFMFQMLGLVYLQISKSYIHLKFVSLKA